MYNMSGIPNKMLPVAVEMLPTLPEGYRRVEYLESTGTQWIDTGFTPKIGDAINLDFSINEKFDFNNSLFSAGDSANQLVAVVAPAEYHRPYFFYRYFCSAAGKIAIEEMQKINCNIDKNGNAFINGTKRAQCTPIGEVNTSLLLFKRVSGSDICQCRIYSFSISRAGSLQINLIPCLDASGKPCMFDTISRKPLYNAGTGQFLYG